MRYIRIKECVLADYCLSFRLLVLGKWETLDYWGEKSDLTMQSIAGKRDRRSQELLTRKEQMRGSDRRRQLTSVVR